MFLPVVTLWGFSLMILGGLSWRLAVNQLGFIALGGGVYWLISRYPYYQHRLFWRQYLLLALILLILPFVFGASSRGAVRWIPLGGWTLQPSELVKPLLIVVFAGYLTKYKSVWGYLSLLALPFGLIFRQPDLGTALVVAAIWLVMLFFHPVSRKQLFWLGLVLSLILPWGFHRLKPYQKERLINFANPYADPAGAGYQVIQAKIAVGSGGWFGQGLGQGSQSQLKFLPERQTDFIFAALAEELGFIAGAIVLMSYFWLLRWLFKIIKTTTDGFGRLLVAGVITLIWFQTAVSVAMNLGLLPVTGITLPLVSAGGSSLLAVMAALGLAGSVWKFSRSGL
jgi:rod shape determining protein RodA